MNNLSDEILMMIFQMIADPKDLISLSKTCRKFWKIISSNKEGKLWFIVIRNAMKLSSPQKCKSFEFGQDFFQVGFEKLFALYLQHILFRNDQLIAEEGRNHTIKQLLLSEIKKLEDISNGTLVNLLEQEKKQMQIELEKFSDHQAHLERVLQHQKNNIIGLEADVEYLEESTMQLRNGNRMLKARLKSTEQSLEESDRENRDLMVELEKTRQALYASRMEHELESKKLNRKLVKLEANSIKVEHQQHESIINTTSKTSKQANKKSNSNDQNNFLPKPSTFRT